MSDRQHSRRDFLKGSAARDGMAGDREGRVPADSSGHDVSNGPAGGYLRVSRHAMGGQFEVFLNAGQYEDGTEAALAVLDEVQRLERQLSIYLATSQVSRVNRLAAAQPVEVEPDLFRLLEAAVALSVATDGALDITAGPLSEVWGFARRRGEIPSRRRLESALARVGYDKLELDEKNFTIRFRVPGMQINLGAIGKGYALDRCAELFAERGIEDFMVHGGLSSIVARGSAAAAVGPPGWNVGLHDPSRHGHRLAEMRLRDRALGTSGSEKQFFRHQGRRLSHVLDPRTGQPAEGLLSATVLAPTATVADALSTALFVMGSDQATTFCNARDELAVVLVRPKGSRVDVVHSGFEPDEFRSLE